MKKYLKTDPKVMKGAKLQGIKSEFQAIGLVEAPISFTNLSGKSVITGTITFVVCSEIRSIILLGTDTLQPWGMKIDFSNQTLTFNGTDETDIPFACLRKEKAEEKVKDVLIIDQSVIIPSRHEMLIPIVTPRLSGTSIYVPPQNVIRSNSQFDPHLRISGSLLDPSRGNCRVLVANFSPKPMKIKKGRVVGCATKVQLEEEKDRVQHIPKTEEKKNPDTTSPLYKEEFGRILEQFQFGDELTEEQRIEFNAC